MRTLMKKAVIAATLAASALTVASPAEARGRYWHRGGDDDAAIAIGAGVIGLALGAAIASSDDGYRHHRRYYYNDGYYYPQQRYYRSYRWDRRYDRDYYYRHNRYHGGYYGGGYYGRGW